MAGFEVIVRPVVFPNIRPAPTRSLPPEDNPEAGLATFSGGSGQVIALTHSFSASGSRPVETEIERTFDEVEVSEDRGGGKGRAADDGGGAKFTTQVATQIKTRDASGATATYNYRPIDESETVHITHKNMKISSEG